MFFRISENYAAEAPGYLFDLKARILVPVSEPFGIFLFIFRKVQNLCHSPIKKLGRCGNIAAMFLYEAEAAFVKFTAKGKESQGKTEQLFFYGFRDQRSADTSRDQGRNR